MKDVINGLALFAGACGLELGLSLALGKRYRTIAYVEREVAAVAVLAANMERGRLDKAPVWDDIETFTGSVISPLVDNIDIISCGFPCQPFSVAGKQLGTEDERWLWPHIERLVREIRPGGVFLENVPGLFHGGIEHVLGDLAALGYDAEWVSVRASDVGAPHRRERVFILAYSSGGRISQPQNGSDLDREVLPAGGRQQGQHGTDSRGDELAHAADDAPIAQRLRRDHVAHAGHGTGRSEQGQQHDAGRGVEAAGVGESGAVDDTETAVGRGRSSDAAQVGGSGRVRPLEWPPGPADTDAWAAVLRERPDLAPAIEPWTFNPPQSEVRDLADGTPRWVVGLGRTDQLRILGNGVVPAQAALAFRLLAARSS